MSLINKMLQDLDARGTGHRDAAQPNIKAVAQLERSVPLRVVVGTLAGALVLGAAGAAGWRYLHKAPAAAQPVTVVMAPAPAHPAAVVTAGAAAGAAAAAPLASAVSAAAPVSAVSAAAPAAALTASPAAGAARAAAPSAVQAIPAKMTRDEQRAENASRAARQQQEARAKQTAEARAGSVRHAQDVRPRHETEVAPAAASKDKHETVTEGREESAGQRAEGAYRRALANLQEGRVTEAMAALRQALQVDAHHDAARQTLVGLLIEHGQPEEAMHQLQLGLTLDPRQPALAMLLARLQIERGGSGVETLMRTLPYAAGNGEYHAFLAGALQRQQRHREAAEQYQAALRGGAQNGVWWMGLGISLQAEKRDAEAIEAFQKAKVSGTLSPELLAFVERKLHALR